MIKLYTSEITSCIGCPNVTNDQNITRYLCRKGFRLSDDRYQERFLFWMMEDEDKQPIPEWCPLLTLTEIDEISEDEMTLT